MKVIEQFVCGKRGEASQCEDGCCATDDFAAVVDGSTSKDGCRPSTPSKGRLAMLVVTQALEQLPAEATLDEALPLLEQALRKASPERAAGAAVERLTCSAAVLSRQRREVWLIGDCCARFDARTYLNSKAVDLLLAEIRSQVVKFALSHGRSLNDIRHDDPGRHFIMPLLKEQCTWQNDPDPNNLFRYAVLDGTPTLRAGCKVLPLGRDTHQVVLASDGYPSLFDTLADTEYALKKMLVDDPLCIGCNKQTKGLNEGQISYDDRCFFRIELN